MRRRTDLLHFHAVETPLIEGYNLTYLVNKEYLAQFELFAENVVVGLERNESEWGIQLGERRI